MAGPKTDSSGQIQKASNAEPPVVRLLQAMKGQIAAALPRHVTPERMSRVALTALRNTPKLLQCTTSSVLGSIMMASQLGLEVNTPLGHAYLIPFSNFNKRLKRYEDVCQLIIGYQGYLDLARRSGMVATPQATIVRKGDLFKVTYGLYPDIQHEPADDDARETRQISHVYAFAHVLPKDSGAPPIFVVLSRAEVLARKARSAGVKAGRSTPWDSDEGAMYLKTGIRALWRWLPKTVEMATAGALEERADQGHSQSGAWDQKVIDAMVEEGVDVDAPAEENVTEDGEILDDSKGSTGSAGPALPEPSRMSAREALGTDSLRDTQTAGGPPPPPPDRAARRTREPGED